MPFIPFNIGKYIKVCSLSWRFLDQPDPESYRKWVFIYICVCGMLVLCMCAQLYAKATASWSLSNVILFDTGSVTESRAHWLDWLTDQWALGSSYLWPYTPCQVTNVCHHTLLFMWMMTFHLTHLGRVSQLDTVGQYKSSGWPACSKDPLYQGFSTFLMLMTL